LTHTRTASSGLRARTSMSGAVCVGVSRRLRNRANERLRRSTVTVAASVRRAPWRRAPVPATIVTLSGSHFATEAEATTVDERQAAVTAVLDRVRKLEGPL